MCRSRLGSESTFQLLESDFEHRNANKQKSPANEERMGWWKAQFVIIEKMDHGTKWTPLDHEEIREFPASIIRVVVLGCSSGTEHF